MSITNKALSAALAGAFFALVAIVAPVQAQSIDTTNVAFVQTSLNVTSIPVGHAEFCASRPGECQPHAQVVAAVELTPARWNELLTVNAHINDTIIAVSDNDLYNVNEFWTYPNGYGDCEDFVLAKRRDLINAGWPASALLIAVVRERNGDGHAVLMVRTDRGDLVLDNQEGTIKLWNETPYQYVKRQSQADAGKWVDMLDDRQVVAAAN